jgi:hydroxyacylglutathione hydrolase
MKVVQKYLANSLRNFNYIIYSEETKEAIFIDPLDLRQTLPIAKKIGVKPTFLLNTHYHPDHIQDNSAYLKIKGTKELKLKDGEELILSKNEKIKCVNTPGHVMDHQCFFLYENDELKSIITGDTIFNSGVGNTRLGGDVETLHNTIRDIFMPLPDNVLIYPSHDYFLTNLKFAKSVSTEHEVIDRYINKYNKNVTDSNYINTTIGEEKLYNPFFKVFNNDNSLEEFSKLRSLRDKW